MAQTYYRRPYSLRWYLTVEATLIILYIIFFFSMAASHTTPVLLLTAFSVIGIIGTLLDPNTCYTTKTMLDDGTVVPVKRPFVGFKSHEDRVGLTGGYEARVDR